LTLSSLRSNQYSAGSAVIGRTLGHYQVVEELGEGGMGVVYKARDIHLDRFVAIKALRTDRSGDEERKRRFTLEAKAASALNHPNIVHIYDIGNADGTDFIAMELVLGKTLKQCIPRGGLPLNEALRLAIQIADALSAAHAAGIVHRDLKPENVIVGENGHVKILDFGLAKLFERAPLSGTDATLTRPATGPLTGEGVIVGTVAYMSPEQAEAKSLDHRSDIFAYGALLYEMVCGQRAFTGESVVATLSSILRSEPKALRQIVEAIPADLERIVSRCLRKDPDRRFQHLSDVKIELEELREALLPARSSSPPGLSVALRLPRARKLAWVAGTAALSLVALLIPWRRLPTSNVAAPDERVMQITNYVGSESEPSFSPDGEELVFTWQGEDGGNVDVYRKLLGSGEPLRLTRDPADDISPAWSPDGKLVAFVRAGDKRQVLAVPALGGPERKLADVSAPRFALELNEGAMTGPYLAWTPDSTHLLIMDRAAADDPFALFLLSLETGEKRQLTFPPADARGDAGASFSPDGRRLAFIRHSAALISDLHLLSLTRDYRPRGEPRRLTVDACRMGGTAWTSDGRSLVFYSERPGASRLWRVAPEGADLPSPIASVGRVGRPIALSRRGNRLAYTEVFEQRHIWRIDLRRAGGEIGSAVKLFASGPTFDAAPRFSPDGSKVAFHSKRSGHNEVWTVDSSGRNLLQLTSFGGPVTGSPRWSVDGRQIAFDSRPAGNADVFVIDAEGGKPRRLTDDPAEDILPSWSHDGRWIYFCSKRSGDRQIWKMPARGGAAQRITRNGGFAAVQSSDGKFVYYALGIGPTSIWRVPADGGEEVQVVESLGYWADFDIADDGIYYVPARSRPAAAEFLVQFHRFADGKTIALGTLDKEPYGISVSRDRRAVLCSLSEPGGADLMLIENFR
jgi:Tol biopolymer transport system component/serine/threonine protein kinase